jgi:uncharacterized membrane protein YjfL (UPF0719 family)
MDAIEAFLLVNFLLITGLFLFLWYRPFVSVWPKGRGLTERVVVGLLPAAAFLIILVILLTLASFDVVGDSQYITFYILMGFAWLYLGEFIMTCFFDLSRVDDIHNMNNRAALYAFSGGFLGIAVIFAASNIGDGPGWWCVVFASGLGTVVWAVMAMAADHFTLVFERVTVDRDIPCGIRLGSFLLANGIILGRASAGDWTSAFMTVIEFLDGWPSLLLILIFIFREKGYMNSPYSEQDARENLSGSIMWGLLMLIFALGCVWLLPPLPKNPFWMRRYG